MSLEVVPNTQTNSSKLNSELNWPLSPMESILYSAVSFYVTFTPDLGVVTTSGVGSGRQAGRLWREESRAVVELQQYDENNHHLGIRPPKSQSPQPPHDHWHVGLHDPRSIRSATGDCEGEAEAITRWAIVLTSFGDAHAL